MCYRRFFYDVEDTSILFRRKIYGQKSYNPVCLTQKSAFWLSKSIEIDKK